MRRSLSGYCRAVAVSLALSWLELGLPRPLVLSFARPAVTRLYDGARVSVTPSLDEPNALVALRVGEHLYLTAADEDEPVFPGSGRLLFLSAPSSHLN
ncbi:MAG: hypothetical protein M0Z94_14450 [Dehalococcoidales bacterium]|nr:hypothetical protein [Dehalococcoidales bacterium]